MNAITKIVFSNISCNQRCPNHLAMNSYYGLELIVADYF